MRKVIITIETTNRAFVGEMLYDEVAGILMDEHDLVINGDLSERDLKDSDGNVVGSLKLEK